MAIFVETNKKLHLCTDGIVVCPIHPQIDSMSNYPITSIRDYYPLEYSHMMHIVKEGVGKGDVIYSDIDGHQKILWVCCHNAYNVAYKLDWIEDGLKIGKLCDLPTQGCWYVSRKGRVWGCDDEGNNCGWTDWYDCDGDGVAETYIPWDDAQDMDSPCAGA